MAFQDHLFRYRYRGPIRVGITLLVIGVGLGFFYALTLLGPRKVDTDALVVDELSEDVQELLARSEALEQKYLAIVAPHEEDRQLLLRAIELQQQYMDRMGGSERQANQRLFALEALYAEAGAKQLWDKSVAAEELAKTLAESDTPLEALPQLERALELQKQIDIKFSQSSYRNAIRTVSLERELTQLRALPLYEVTQREEELALQAIAGQQWEGAQEHYAKAIEAQQQLNTKFRGLRYADLNRLAELEVELATLQSQGLQQKLVALIEQANQQFAAKAYRQAAQLFEQAVPLQAELNEAFPTSRFASDKELDALKTWVQTAKSQGLGEALLSQAVQLEAYLMERKLEQAVELINSLNQAVAAFLEKFPRSTILSDAWVERLQYLSSAQGDLGWLQERIYGQLQPLPTTKQVHMATTEVVQALYASIMATNPSRNQGERLPVDSVNYEEAKVFCQKVSWVLAREVRLPHAAEFRAAVGSLDGVGLDDMAWHTDNSYGLSQPVKTLQANAHGFYDLLGNVAEWLESDGASDGGSGERLGSVSVAGGSAGDAKEFLADIPVVSRSPASRNRLTGFRYVVVFE